MVLFNIQWAAAARLKTARQKETDGWVEQVEYWWPLPWWDLDWVHIGTAGCEHKSFQGKARRSSLPSISQAN